MLTYINHLLFVVKQVLIDPYLNKILFILNLLHIPAYFKTVPFTFNNISVNNKEICDDTFIIPRNLFLCYKTKNIPPNILSDISKSNPGWKIYLYDDIMCKEFILQHFGLRLSELFTTIKDGPIKADLFRICILYINGGVYTDIDNILLKPLNTIIQEGITFAVGGSYMPHSLNPAFIASVKKNPILLQCIKT